MRHLESAHQQQVIEWARMASRSAKGQGMLSGVPDLFLPVPKNGFHGLFIEMKSEKGRVTENQPEVKVTFCHVK